jgi:hypothetical protein
MPFLSGGADSSDNDGNSSEPQIIIVEPGEPIPGQVIAPNEGNAPGETGGKKEVDPNPVGVQDGLGSLDSYKFFISFKSHDEKGSINDMTSTIQRSVVDKASYTVTSATTFDPDDDEEVETETTYSYSVDNATCTFDGEDDYELEELSDQDKEMRDIFSSMIDILPIIEDPVFVGEEMMNGIQCNHFTFKLNGIGDTSGSVATVNEGEYWLAVDGQYIVRYSLKLEVRSGAEGTEGAEVSYLESYMDLTDVNVPVSVTLPPECFVIDEDD